MSRNERQGTGYQQIAWSWYKNKNSMTEVLPNGKDIAWNLYGFNEPTPSDISWFFQETIPSDNFDITLHIAEWKKRNLKKPIVVLDLFSPGGYARSQIEALSAIGLWDSESDLAISVTLEDLREDDLKRLDDNNNLRMITGNFLSRKKRGELKQILSNRSITSLLFYPHAGYQSLPSIETTIDREKAPWGLQYLYHHFQFLYHLVDNDQGIMFLQAPLDLQNHSQFQSFIMELQNSDDGIRQGRDRGGHHMIAVSVVKNQI